MRRSASHTQLRNSAPPEQGVPQAVYRSTEVRASGIQGVGLHVSLPLRPQPLRLELWCRASGKCLLPLLLILDQSSTAHLARASVVELSVKTGEGGTMLTQQRAVWGRGR